MREAGKKRTLEDTWGADVCSRCGRELVLGEGIARIGAPGKELRCPECAALPAEPDRRSRSFDSIGEESAA